MEPFTVPEAAPRGFRAYDQEIVSADASASPGSWAPHSSRASLGYRLVRNAGLLPSTLRPVAAGRRPRRGAGGGCSDVVGVLTSYCRAPPNPSPRRVGLQPVLADLSPEGGAAHSNSAAASARTPPACSSVAWMRARSRIWRGRHASVQFTQLKRSSTARWTGQWSEILSGAGASGEIGIPGDEYALSCFLRLRVDERLAEVALTSHRQPNASSVLLRWDFPTGLVAEDLTEGSAAERAVENLHVVGSE